MRAQSVVYKTHVSASAEGCGTRFAPSQRGELYADANVFSDTFQGALRRRGPREGRGMRAEGGLTSIT